MLFTACFFGLVSLYAGWTAAFPQHAMPRGAAPALLILAPSVSFLASYLVQDLRLRGAELGKFKAEVSACLVS